MENLAFTRVNLFNVRVIMMIMCVPVEELLCQVVVQQIPILECLLSRACGRLWLRPTMLGIKHRCFLRTQLQWPFLVLGSPRV
jgi:hypothetical protein